MTQHIHSVIVPVRPRSIKYYLSDAQRGALCCVVLDLWLHDVYVACGIIMYVLISEVITVP